MTEPTPDTFDIADLFSGKAYPKDQVETFLDEDTAYEIQKNNQAIAKAVAAQDEDELEILTQRHEALVKKAAASRIVVHVTGVSRRERKAIIDSVLEEFPNEYNFLGQAKPNPQADEKHANLKWALHIEKIERADGSVLVAPDPATIRVFRENAPDYAVADIEKAILALSEGAESGFETLVQEHDFLSRP